MVELQVIRHELKSKETYTSQATQNQRLDISTTRIQTKH